MRKTSHKILYDKIGHNYAQLRRPDPRLAAMIRENLGDARSVINVGAGAGSYEPADLDVTAVEPSIEMIRQRPEKLGPAILGVAENLPFENEAFDAALAILTVHHWTDARRGIAQMKRVARERVVIFTFDPDFGLFWLADYLPELLVIDHKWAMPISDIEDALGRCVTTSFPIPHDCQDGFLAAYWRRPSAYLDPHVRAAISSFSKMHDTEMGLAKLAEDLETGVWSQKYGHLLEQDALDCGYRLMRCELS